MTKKERLNKLIRSIPIVEETREVFDLETFVKEKDLRNLTIDYDYYNTTGTRWRASYVRKDSDTNQGSAYNRRFHRKVVLINAYGRSIEEAIHNLLQEDEY